MNKYLKLVLCIIIDIIGSISYFFPGVGEISDVIWAPISAISVFLLFGKQGTGAAIINFTEELIPGSDILPTLTLTWIYVHVIEEKKKKKNDSKK